MHRSSSAKSRVGVSLRAMPSVVLLAALVVFQATPAVAAPGELDPAFGEGGRVITGYDGPLDDVPYWEMEGFYGRAYGVAIQADGKIVVVGSAEASFGVARHLADGTLDASFGGTGAFVTTFAAPSAAYDVAIQADGKIVVVGTAGRYAWPGNSFAIARFTPDGVLDPSFGGDGMVRTRFGRTPARAHAVTIQPDGKLVVAGLAGKAFALARYDSDGSLDPTFSGDGRLRTRVLEVPLSESATDVVVQADGGILMSGDACDEESCSVALARYDSSGSTDDAFGEMGVVLVPAGYAVGDLAVQPDGAIVVGSGRRLYRFRADGSPDTSFSDDGLVRTTVGADGVALQADGKIVVTGPVGWEDFTFTVARFDPAGALDLSFGNEGRAWTDFPGFQSVAYALAVQADGKIVTVGTTSNINIDGKFALARFLAS